MIRLPPRTTLASLIGRPRLQGEKLTALMLEHFYRGARIQRLLRLMLIAVFAGALLSQPPDKDLALCWVIVICYALWSTAIGVLIGSASPRAIPFVWMTLFVDVVATIGLTLVVDSSAAADWTPYIIINGLLFIPMVAAAQLNAWASGVVCAAAAAAYLVGSVTTRSADGSDPWSVIVLRTALLAALGVGAVLISSLQEHRVSAIAALAADRARLVEEMVVLQERERRDLAEHLHDGALQYVLAARQDLEDVGGDATASDRVDYALGLAIGLLRSTLTQLHPAVVQEAGLVPALRDLADDVSRRSGLAVELTQQGWDDSLRTSADAMLLSTARELLTNVIKHAQASRVAVELTLDSSLARPIARLVVADDGIGLRDAELADRLRDGHLGLASRRIHIEGAGGTLHIGTESPHGTRIVAAVPATVTSG